MKNYIFDYKTLLEKTENGLNIVLKYIDVPAGCEPSGNAKSGKKPFHFRDKNSDKTPSAWLFFNGQTWGVKDFGDKFYSAIQIVQDKFGLEYFEALKRCFDDFGLTDNEFYKPKLVFKEVNNNEYNKEYFFIKKREKIQNTEVIGRFVTDDLCKQYYFSEVEYYEKVIFSSKTNSLQLMQVYATEQTPIYCYQPQQTWAKIYVPTNKDFKHSFVGVKPQNYFFGLDNLKKQVDEILKNLNNERNVILAKKEPNITDRIRLEGINEELSKPILPKIFICSGGTDGLNLASLGYSVIWGNSESEKLTTDDYQYLKTYSKGIYNVPDIDVPGLKYAYELAEKFWNLKTIYLPKKNTKGKDLREWMRFYRDYEKQRIVFEFNKLITNALRLNFIEFNDKKPTISPSYLHYFLKVKGFFYNTIDRNHTELNNQQEYMFVHIVENVVKQVFPRDIREFSVNFMIEKGQNIKIIDLIKTSTQFTDLNLQGLSSIKLDYKNYTYDTQTFYFKNQFVEVSKESITHKAYKHLSNNVFEKDIKKQNIQVEQPYFTYENGVLGIVKTDSQYMNYLINASRVFWKDELQTPFINENGTINETEKAKYHTENKFTLWGKALNPEQQQTQQQHFLSKLFAIGYLMHNQKIMSYAKMVLVMDDKVKKTEDEQNGRSGKGVFALGIRALKKFFWLDGKKDHNDRHLLDGLDESHELLHIEDMQRYGSLEVFYNYIAGNTPVNPKQKKPFVLDFYNSPKMLADTNFGLQHINPSILGRLFFISFSDYYHVKTDEYLEERTIASEFGNIDFFSERWTATDWNNHYNFMFNCLQFYLQNRDNAEEFTAPMQNIKANNLKSAIGDNFIEWANGYFMETEVNKETNEVSLGNLNVFAVKQKLIDDYKLEVGKNFKSAQNFKKALKDYCILKGWELNPKEHQGKDGRIVEWQTYKNITKTYECFYIQTNPETTNNEPNKEIIPEITDPNIPF